MFTYEQGYVGGSDSEIWSYRETSALRNPELVWVTKPEQNLEFGEELYLGW